MSLGWSTIVLTFVLALAMTVRQLYYWLTTRTIAGGDGIMTANALRLIVTDLVTAASGLFFCIQTISPAKSVWAFVVIAALITGFVVLTISMMLLNGFIIVFGAYAWRYKQNIKWIDTITLVSHACGVGLMIYAFAA